MNVPFARFHLPADNTRKICGSAQVGQIYQIGPSLEKRAFQLAKTELIGDSTATRVIRCGDLLLCEKVDFAEGHAPGAPLLETGLFPESKR